MTTRKPLTYIAAYAIVAFLVFGWCYNNPRDSAVACIAGTVTDRYDKISCDHNIRRHIEGSFVAALLWPFWAGGSLGIMVTKWP